MSDLSPLDLLDLSDTERAIVWCLNHNPHSTISDLARATAVPVEKLQPVLRQMINASQLVEQVKEGQTTFLVQYRRDAGRTRTRSSSMLDLFE